MMTLATVLPLLSASLLAAGTPVTIDGLTSSVPASWKELPATQMRFKQFTVPKVDPDKNDAEMVVFFFGPGGGGDVQANLTRWKGMFVPPEGKSIDDIAKTQTFKVSGIDVTTLDVRGTYKYKPAPMAPNEELRPGHRMIAVVFASPQGPYFMRFVGPEKTIDKNKKDFDKFLKGFKK
jgi:hypothetical protein